ncbi:Major facilitator family transporter [Pseudomonas chlororaphis]|uniref:Major facilitator family transporter n=1 Tax=Pseudomonas chlororaphis TaxID=587753 RepID=A0A3G7TM92_9PSED|nr:Major facilitator family transporter [Pseudomonas chlororaphis]
MQHAVSTEKLPSTALLAFAMTSFIAILTETLLAGLLPQIGAGLNVSEVLAGQLVTLYAWSAQWLSHERPRGTVQRQSTDSVSPSR